MVRLTDCSDMTIAVCDGHKTITQQVAEVRQRYYFIGGGSRGSVNLAPSILVNP